MSNRIGFVILSHTNPSQVLRLIRTLSRMYDNPPIACHHDFSQSLLSHTFPSNVHFVSPHVRTRWAQFSIVAASLRALELLYNVATPDWFVFLSGSDYPTMNSEAVLSELMASKADALLDYREVPIVFPDHNHSIVENPALRHYASTKNLALAWQRYVGANVWFPIIRRGPRLGRYTVSLPIPAWRSPFGPSFKCYYGDFWFMGNRKVATLLLNPTRTHLQLRRYLRRRIVPDECYYHSVI